MTHARSKRLQKLLWILALSLSAAAGCADGGGSSRTPDAAAFGGHAVETDSPVGAGRTNGDGSTAPTCRSQDFSIESSLSSAISTVGIVDWAFAGTVTEAHIDFGRMAGSWEYRAPATDPKTGINRTLLLGMKEKTTYSYQIVVTTSEGTCASDTHTITTGPKRNGLPPVQVDTPRPEEVYAGFTIMCQCTIGEMVGTAYIIDRDGDIVWWLQDAATDDCSAAEMSYDGQYLFASALNVDTTEMGKLTRVLMDGTGERAYEIPRLHHHFSVGPDGKIAFIEYDSDHCDDIKELDPETGVTRSIYAIAEADPSQTDECHSNAINWWPAQNLYTVSVLGWNAIVAFTRAGQKSWILGGTAPTISGGRWNRQHNHHLTSESSLLLFNNENDDGTSSAREYAWTGAVAGEIWSYSGGIMSNTLGDAKRLPNGNTLVTFSNNGVIQEVNASGQLVQSITTKSAGYTVRRSTLYGPPPPWAW